jgi:hypothetical protein
VVVAAAGVAPAVAASARMTAEGDGGLQFYRVVEVLDAGRGLKRARLVATKKPVARP